MTPRTLALAVVLALPLAVLGPPATTHASDAAAPSTSVRVDRDPAARALDRLDADARGPIRLTRGPDGLARVVAATGVHDPEVSRSTPLRTAARLHLARYGALLGLADPASRLVAGSVRRSVTGDRVVRFTQERDGLPVIAGAVAVDLRPDRQLASLTASTSRARVGPALVTPETAAAEALSVVRKRVGDGIPLRAATPERRLWDPAVLGVRRTQDPTTHARGVWWVAVRAGATVHRTVLVDDRTGGVVLDLDQDEAVNRVVCDHDNDMTQLDLPCTSDFARVEGGPRSAVADVNDAYRLAGVVAQFYHRIGGIDLTALLGVDEGDHQSLSSTVRYCDPFQPAAACPLANAFWNGVGMFYGEGYASADDVVGHEMTHGVIQHSSDLFYWGQSGAINESMADVMGEIIDHRHPGKGDSPHSWTIGEDLPYGAIRDLRRPGRFGQPDSTTSKRYLGGMVDDGGVHENSGVGNRTFYLVSQGGRQGGLRVHGIDGPSLTRSATLYLDTIQHLVSGSDYADLAAVLVRSCHDLVRHHRVGMTSADCRQVNRATVATGLRTSPRHARQPADAPMTCPRGSGPVRVLLDSEKGDPSSVFDAGDTWVRAPDSTVFPPVLANATSGHRSWFAIEPMDVSLSSLTMHPVALPEGWPAYLWFQQWRVLDSGTRYDGKKLNYDAGTVQVADPTRGHGQRPAEGMPWVNGPRDRIYRKFQNPSPGRIGFSRDSHGYLASRLRLSRFGGDAVSPQFTMSTDNNSTDVGWYLDDIRVYTCGRGPVPTSTPTITGTQAVGSVLTADPGRWAPVRATLRLQWYADGEPVAGATGTTYTVRDEDAGSRLTVRVTASSHHRHTTTSSPATAPISPPVTGSGSG
ncbi:MAG: M4 family metallopeptidase [Nocardioides sp.]